MGVNETLRAAVQSILDDPRIKPEIVNAYVALCGMPPNVWRAQNQRILAGLRDHIAEALGADAENVQNAAEDRAAGGAQ